jgi:hypothetical protein
MLSSVGTRTCRRALRCEQLLKFTAYSCSVHVIVEMTGKLASMQGAVLVTLKA